MTNASRLYAIVVALLVTSTFAGALAQTTAVLKAGESLNADAGEVLYMVNFLQSNNDAGPMPGFYCTIQIGFNQIAVGINAYSNSSKESGPAVLSGPAKLTVQSDSAITYHRVRESGFHSVIMSKDVPTVINISANTTCILFPPLLIGDWNSKMYAASKCEIGAVTMTNVTFYPPTQISGPALISLGMPAGGISAHVNTAIATFQWPRNFLSVISAGISSRMDLRRPC